MLHQFTKFVDQKYCLLHSLWNRRMLLAICWQRICSHTRTAHLQCSACLAHGNGEINQVCGEVPTPAPSKSRLIITTWTSTVRKVLQVYSNLVKFIKSDWHLLWKQQVLRSCTVVTNCSCSALKTIHCLDKTLQNSHPLKHLVSCIQEDLMTHVSIKWQ